MPMSEVEYREALDRLDLAQEEAAKLFGVDGRTSRRWALGERTIPGPVETLLRLLLSRPELLEVVRDIKKRELPEKWRS